MMMLMIIAVTMIVVLSPRKGRHAGTSICNITSCYEAKALMSAVHFLLELSTLFCSDLKPSARKCL